MAVLAKTGSELYLSSAFPSAPGLDGYYGANSTYVASLNGGFGYFIDLGSYDYNSQTYSYSHHLQMYDANGRISGGLIKIDGYNQSYLEDIDLRSSGDYIVTYITSPAATSPANTPRQQTIDVVSVSTDGTANKIATYTTKTSFNAFYGDASTATGSNGTIAVLHNVASGSTSRVVELIDSGGHIFNSVNIQSNVLPDTVGTGNLTALSSGRFLVTWQQNHYIGTNSTPGNTLIDRVDLIGTVIDSVGNIVTPITNFSSSILPHAVASAYGQVSIAALHDGGFVTDFQAFGYDFDPATVHYDNIVSSADIKIWSESGSAYLASGTITQSKTLGVYLAGEVSTLADGSIAVTWSDGSLEFGDSSGRSFAQLYSTSGANQGAPLGPKVEGKYFGYSHGLSANTPHLTPLKSGRVLLTQDVFGGITTSSDSTNGYLTNSLGGIKTFGQLLEVSSAPSGIDTTPFTPSLIPYLQDYGFAQGWGSDNNPRLLADVDYNGSSDYVAFGNNYTFVSRGITGSDGQGHFGPSFTNGVGIIRDFGTSQGYTAEAQRGIADTGYGVAGSVYGQGFAGVYWYGATSQKAQFDAAKGVYGTPEYETVPHLYAQFGTQQGWTIRNGFEVVKASPSDRYASILGFGNSGIIVGEQAFAPNADASKSYLIPIAVGNSSGWDQTVDVRTFQDNKGHTLDLNHDGIADFLGMGPQGTVFAFGLKDTGGHYGLGQLQTATFGASASDLGRAQGWTDQNTLRVVVHNDISGYDDIFAFGGAGVYVAQGQDPGTHGGQPFGALHLGIADFGIQQGWSNDLTPRLVGDVNGDHISDIVGFGANSTFVALGSLDSTGSLHFALDPSKTINDFGYNQGWNANTLRTLADVDGSGHDSLVLSGGAGTQIWHI